ncbi:MAG TPA: uroporphyrinogen-III C-methyltransferase, partial [Myxococcota bacterium]|nr:uroporphyrinogen-III C-methyltransferase [Myxococcota bacterium]
MSAEIESLSTDVNARRPGRGVSPMLVALAVLGLLLALYANWRIGRYDTRYERLRGQIAELRATQDKLDGRLQWLTADLESSRATWRNELRDLREVPAQVQELGRSVEELRARTEAPQRAWVRAEALYLLELAERRIELERDVQTAIAAMESADGRLATLDDPAMREVRAKLGTEIAGLRAVQLPELPEILNRIGRLEDAVPTLPVIGMPVSEVRRTRQEVEADGALARAWRRIAQAARDLVSLRRIEPATARLVTQEEDSLRRQHLELLLFSARIAAMRPDGAAFAQSLRAAGAWIEQYFDTARPE